MALTVGGLFSGIGGWELGLERAGMTVTWHCEADPFCRRVLGHHWPHVPCFEDVTTLGNPPYVDVLAGGFPCQDISVAGKGAGLEGARSGLWSEFARLIGEVGPRYVLVENVSALLGRGLGTVLADLAALGYDAEWDCIPASAFGAPHRRDRVWLVAYPQLVGRAGREDVAGGHVTNGDHARWTQEAGGPQDSSIAGRGGAVADADRSGPQGRPVPLCQRAEVPRTRNGGPLADADRERLEGREPQREQYGVGARASDTGAPSLYEWWEVEPNVGRVADGVPARVDRLRSLGNALVPQVAEWIGRRIVAYEESGSVAP